MNRRCYHHRVRGLAVLSLVVVTAGCLAAPDGAHIDAGDGDGDDGGGDRDGGLGSSADSGAPGCDVMFSDSFEGTDMDFDLWQAPTTVADSAYLVSDDEVAMVARSDAELPGSIKFSSALSAQPVKQLLHARLRAQTVGPGATGGVGWESPGGTDSYAMSVRDGRVVALRLNAEDGQAEPTVLCAGCPLYEGETIEVRLRSDGIDIYFENLTDSGWGTIASVSMTDLEYSAVIGGYAPVDEEMNLAVEQVTWYQCSE